MWSLKPLGNRSTRILVEREPEHAKKEAKFQFTRNIHLTGKFQSFFELKSVHHDKSYNMTN